MAKACYTAGLTSPFFATLLAQFCAQLMAAASTWPAVMAASAATDAALQHQRLFRRCLLTAMQAEFEGITSWCSDSSEEEAPEGSEAWFTLNKRRDRALGNTRMLAQLFVQGVVGPKVLCGAMNSKLSDVEKALQRSLSRGSSSSSGRVQLGFLGEVELEHVCLLLTQGCTTLAASHHRALHEAYTRLSKLSSRLAKARLRFMCADTVEACQKAAPRACCGGAAGAGTGSSATTITKQQAPRQPRRRQQPRRQQPKKPAPAATIAAPKLSFGFKPLLHHGQTKKKQKQQPVVPAAPALPAKLLTPTASAATTAAVAVSPAQAAEARETMATIFATFADDGDVTATVHDARVLEARVGRAALSDAAAVAAVRVAAEKGAKQRAGASGCLGHLCSTSHLDTSSFCKALARELTPSMLGDMVIDVPKFAAYLGETLRAIVLSASPAAKQVDGTVSAMLSCATGQRVSHVKLYREATAA